MTGQLVGRVTEPYYYMKALMPIKLTATYYNN